MSLNNRIIFDDNGSFTDYTPELNDFSVGTSTIPAATATFKIYIGSTLPFNNRWWEVSTVNASPSSISVEIYNGNEWKNAVDVTDQTSSGGISLSKSGHITWSVDRTDIWQRKDTDQITELSSFKIFGLYWARFSWSGTVDAATVIDFMGFKFSTDTELKQFYPELLFSTSLEAFETGKTNWNQQHVWAAEAVIRDLMRRNILFDQNQIIRVEKLREASIHKCAEIIFRAFGKDRIDDTERARQYFDEAIDMTRFDVDRNRNTRLDREEIIPSFEVVRR